MDEATFHRTRRMFCLLGKSLLLAEVGRGDTHREWLQELFGFDTACNIIHQETRGYALGGMVVLYRGEDFSARVDHAAVRAVLPQLEKLFDAKDVGFGVVPGAGQPWEPRIVMTVRDYMSRSV